MVILDFIRPAGQLKTKSDNPLECIKKYFRVHRKEIAYLRFVLESYSGIATLRTLDAKMGKVVLHVPSGCQKEVETLLKELSTELMIEPSDEN